MKPNLKKILILCTLSTTLLTQTKTEDSTTTTGGYSFFTIRSQGRNSAKRLVGWQDLIHKYENKQEKNIYESLNISVEYNRSFHSKKIAEYLFNTDTLQFIGSLSPKFRNDGTQIMADYFGLPYDYEGVLHIKPKIYGWVMDISWFVGFDKWLKGSFLKIYAPIAYTNWNLNFDEERCERGSIVFPNGYMSRNSSSCDSKDLTACFITQAFKGFTFGDMKSCWKYGMVDGAQSKTKLADLRAELGWNYVKEKASLGFAIVGAAPTGNKPNGEYLFEPISGNGSHWELGGAFNAHFKFGERDDANQSFGIYIDGNITHLFKSKQTRSLGLTVTPCCPLSCNPNPCCPSSKPCVQTCSPICTATCLNLTAMNRYMLLKEFAPNTLKTNNQYTGNIINAINVLTWNNNVTVRVNVSADISAKIAFNRGNFEMDLGYNFYGQSKEKVKITGCPPCGNKYGLKGNTGVALSIFKLNLETMIVTDTGTARLDTTHSNATIGYNGSLDSAAIFTQEQIKDTVSGRDPRFCNNTTYSETINVVAQWDDLDGTLLTSANFFTTNNKQVLGISGDIAPASAPSIITNKIFTHANYCWKDIEKWRPFVGVGGEVEFGTKKAALNQWGIWIKGGINF